MEINRLSRKFTLCSNFLNKKVSWKDDQCIANVIVHLIDAIKGGGLFDLPDISSGKECQERSDILVFLDA